MMAQIIGWEEGWASISTGIGKMINSVEGGGLKAEDKINFEDYMSVYQTVFKMCSQNFPHKHSQQLYDRYRKWFEEYLTFVVLPALTKLQHADELMMLREVVKRWRNQKVILGFMSSMFHYVERYLVLPLTLREVGSMCFREVVYDGIVVNNVIFKLINRERDGDQQIDRALLKNCVDFFVEMGMDYYRNDFEKPFFEDSATYYARKAALWISEDSCPEYMIKAEQYLEHEEHIVVQYLHATSEQKLVEIVQTELLSRYETQLLEKQDSGCYQLLRDDKKNDISRMYRLFCRIPKGLEPVEGIFQQHVTSEGIALVKRAEDAVKDMPKSTRAVQEEEFLQNVIELHDKYLQEYVEHTFQNNKAIFKAFREAFVGICNKKVGGSTSAELLAAFCDNFVKKGGNGKMRDDPNKEESMLEKAIKLVEYVDDKDLFAEFCRKKLYGRLLQLEGVNIGDEQRLLLMLKGRCCPVVLRKLEGMLKDLTFSKEIQASFNNSNNDLNIFFGATLLNTALWPTHGSTPHDLILPLEMGRCLEVFQEFYSRAHKDRKLTWIYSLGTCDIMCKFDSKVIEMTVTPYQAIVLLFFNDSVRLSYQEIKSRLNLGDKYVTALLHSISCGKYPILLKDPSAPATVSTSDNFEVNPSFNHRLSKINIPLPLVVEDAEKVIEEVDKHRIPAIDAALVRIMKFRKVLTQQQLITEFFKELQRWFKPNMKTLKKRIDHLIADDYFERDLQDSNKLKYLPSRD